MTSVDELFTEVRALVDSRRVPACQAAVGFGGDVVAFETFGAATNTTRFCIFSATKPMVASVVWLLIADGLADPAEPIGHYVPELVAGGLGDVTLEQVLLHTAGFPNAPMTDFEGADAERRRARFQTWRPEWPAGSRFEYHAQSAHWVLADVIDRLTGRDYRDVLEDRVFAPLGLRARWAFHSIHRLTSRRSLPSPRSSQLRRCSGSTNQRYVPPATQPEARS